MDGTRATVVDALSRKLWDLCVAEFSSPEKPTYREICAACELVYVRATDEWRENEHKEE